MTVVAAGALVLAAFNLRPAMASVGPLLDQVQEGLAMNGTVAGLLLSVPPACFAVFGMLTPALLRRASPAAVLVVAMAMVAGGLVLRATAGDSAIFVLCSATALAGIGIGNVVLPVAVKRYFPHRIGIMTGLYSMALTVGAAGAAAVAVPLTDRLGGSWRLGLGVWAIPAVAAAGAGLLLRARRAPDPGAPAAAFAPVRSPLRNNRMVWALSVFFGLQATGAYVTLGWMSQILRDAGVSPERAGLLLALTPTVGIPLAFVMPTIATRMRHQSALAAVLTAVALPGYLGLWLAPAATPWLWAILLGVSQSTFPLALTMIGLRSGPDVTVARLSAFTQSVGYLISIPGPIVVGALYQHTSSWALPLAFMIALLIPQVAAGAAAGRDHAALRPASSSTRGPDAPRQS
ncbi:MAG: MFS transporter [Jatrophihabitans sp.]